MRTINTKRLMKTKRITNIMRMTKKDLDALREILNIGVGHASTALSELANSKIRVSFPSLKQCRIEDVPGFICGAETVVASVYLGIDALHNGAKSRVGSFLFINTLESARTFTGLVLRRKKKTRDRLGKGVDESGKDLDELGEDLLKETGNILSGAGLNVISEMLDVPLIESLPDISIDRLSATLDALLSEIGSKSESVLVFKTNFSIDRRSVQCHVVFLLDDFFSSLLLEKIRKKFR